MSSLQGEVMAKPLRYNSFALPRRQGGSGGEYVQVPFRECRPLGAQAARSRMSEEQKSHLSPRDCEILKDVVRTYIFTGEPVSSRSLAKRPHHELSAASIRNVMADLEDCGYLTQPHTSAGRVPTHAGYHFYIDALMPARGVPDRERRYIDENIREAPSDGEQLMGAVTSLLTELSHQIAIVVTPALGDTVLRSVDFVQLSGARVLCVLVSASGFVDNKVIETLRPLPREELVTISNYLTENFAGLNLRQIRDRLLEMMAEERAQVDQLLASAITLAQEALGTEGEPEVLVQGTSSVLVQPELSDIERVRKLMGTFSDKAKLVRMLGQLMHGSGVRVIIGEESDLTSDLDFSLVATTYVPLVSYLGEALSQALETTLGE
jgi:heat-inducible transcriptional repressor